MLHAAGFEGAEGILTMKQRDHDLPCIWLIWHHQNASFLKAGHYQTSTERFSPQSNGMETTENPSNAAWRRHVSFVVILSLVVRISMQFCVDWDMHPDTLLDG